jgi:type IX secretion system PorP/SprF family membrane protein
MKNIYIILISLFWVNLSFAQDMHFAQIEQTPQFINPALLGAFDGDHRATLNYKSQWASIVSPYKTMALQYDGRYSGKQWNSDVLTFGLTLFKDEAGEMAMKTLQLNLGVGYIKTLNRKHSISTGLQVGWAKKGFEQSDARWDNQYDPSASGGYNPSFDSHEIYYGNSFSFLDLNMGFAWTYTSSKYLKMRSGISIYHIAPVELKYTEDNVEIMDRRWNAHFSLYRKLKNTNLTLIPTFLFMNQGTIRETLLGLTARYNLVEGSKYTGFIKDMYFEIGGQYRIGDAFVFSAGYAWRNFKFVASYAINVSKLSVVTKGNGGFEVSLVYITPFERKNTGNTML